MAILFAAIAVSIAAPDKDKIIANEKAAWQAYKDKKADEFRKYVSAEYHSVYSNGVYTLDKELAAMTKTDLKSFDLTGFDVTSTDAETAIITYQATVQMTVDGKDASGTYNSVSVWRMTGGTWSVILHSNVPQEKATAPAK
ncbi:MAG: nuclear transport factor 2 family protein [Spartobacteria bacterium]